MKARGGSRAGSCFSAVSCNSSSLGSLALNATAQCLPLPGGFDNVSDREIGSEIVHLPPQVLDVGQTGQEAPLVPFPWQAGGQAQRPRPTRVTQARLEGMHDHLTRHMLGGDGNLSQSPQIADHLRERQHDIARKAAQAAEVELLGDKSFEPVAVERHDRAQQRPMRTIVDVASLGAAQYLLDGLHGEIANALTPLDQPRERTEECYLLGGVGSVAVRVPGGPDHGVAPFPGPQTRGSQPGELRGLVDFVRPIPAGDRPGVRVPSCHVTITDGRSCSPNSRYTSPSEKIPRQLSLRPLPAVVP